jgi:hypothetical protein
MEITNVTFNLDSDGYPYVGLTINGTPARLHVGQKSPILDMGYIELAPASIWSLELQPITIPADPEIGRSEVVLRGFIYSPELVALHRKFLRDLKTGKFTPGPVRFP